MSEIGRAGTHLFYLARERKIYDESELKVQHCSYSRYSRRDTLLD